MNHIYRLVWNHITHAWVCCAETARGRGKTGSGRKSRVTGHARSAGVLATGALASSLALAGPTGGQISAGAGSITQSGHTTTITQTSQNLAINWQGFDIAANESVRFNQPNAASVALNRVTGQNPSQILGSLSANGQVFVLNPNGVLFGAGAQVNVGGLVASTLGLSDAKLMAGSYTFESTSRSIDGAVVNKGTLNSAPGGYIALLAPEVRNEGSISATQGTALLAAGKQVTVNLNNGSLLGYHIDQGALKALADNQQLIQADGGTVILSAKAADALASAVVNNSGIIEARTLNKVGGVIKLMGDMDYGTVHVGGTLDASAGAFAAAAAPTNSNTANNTSNGGFIETSAAHVKIADNAKITTASAMGLAGSWLIDPVDFTIAASGGDLTGATLTNQLVNNNVIIYSLLGETGTAGDVNVNDAVSWSANKLTLNARHNININAVMNVTGSASLFLQYAQGGGPGDYIIGANGKVNLPSNSNAFVTQAGGNWQSYGVITSLAQLQGSTCTNCVLGADIDAGAGFSPRIGHDGIFAGLGHTISNLNINLPSGNNVGLFGATTGNAVLRDLHLVNARVTGQEHVGALVGQASGTIINCSATGPATGNMVTGSSYVGGLVGTGTANLTIANSYATGNVAGNGFYHGGLVGRNYGTISSSYATGAVNSNDIAGGLVGVNDGTISNSYATGVVNGGIVGGLVGENSGTVNNSYATGRVNGSSYVGGLVGRNSRTVSNSYWDIGSSGQTSSAGGLGLTSAEMQQMSKFAGFDFAGTWFIYEGYTNPLLRSFLTPLTVGNPTKNYDGLTAGNSAFGLPADHIFGTLTYTGSANGAIYPGTYTATSLGGLYSDQQGYAITFVDGALTVNPRPLTVSGITADAKVYDATTAATLNLGTVSFSGILPGDTVSITPGTITGAFADKNAGSNKAINLSGVSLSGTNASYYTLNGVLSANITPKPLSSGISVVEKVYDGKTNATLSNNGVPALLAAQAPGTGTTADGKPYTGDAVSFRGSATGTYNDKNVAEATTVYLDGLVLGGAERGNYSIQREVAGTISPKEVAIDLKIVPRVKTYDGTTTVTVDAYQWFNNASEPWANYMAPASFYTNGLVSSVDQFQSATGTGNFNSKDVATANQITLTSIAFNNYDGNAGRMAYGSNYHLIPGPGTTYFNATGVQTGVQTVPKITPKALTASVTASNKVYDGSTVAAPILTITGGLVGTETLSASGTATFNSKDVATANLVTVNSTTLTNGSNGGLAGNYSLASGQTAAASITPANITLTGLTASNKTYDGDTTATVTGTAAVTALAGDSVSVSGTASGAFADKNVGIAKAVNISGLSLSGADASNYTIAPLTADIAQLPSVSWTGGSTGNWSDSANWAGGITPNLANVAAVVIPAGVNVTYDSGVSGTTTLSSLTSSGKLTVAAGTLATTGNLSTAGFQQTGGTVNVGGNLDINTSSAIVMGNTHITGNLSATTTGADISQTTGTSMSVGGTSSLVANSGSQRYGIVLNGVGNDFVGAVSVSSAKVKLVDSSGGLTLGNIDAQGTANLISLGGDISQTAGSSVNVSGTTTLTAADMLVTNGQRYNVTLGNNGNNFVGAVSADANQVTLVDGTGGLILGKIGGNVIQGTSGSISQASITSLGGDISQTAASIINVTGSSNLVANSGSQRYHITLANAGNDFGGAVSTNAANLNVRDSNALSVALDSTGSSTLNAAGALQLAGSVGGTLDVTNSGATSLNGTLSVNGANTTSTNGSVTVNGTAGAVIQ